MDIGATWMRAAIVDAQAKLGPITRRPTEPQRPPQQIADDIAAMVEQLVASADKAISAIGIGIPTTLDDDGRLDPSPNLPTLTRFPLRDTLADRLGLPVHMDNDARCFALGEARYGAGVNCRVVAGLTLGTGIGLGIAIDGKPHRGAHRQAGEIWRAPNRLDRPPNDQTNVEAIVSGMAIERAYHAATGTKLDGPEIARRAAAGDQAAQRIFTDFGRALGNVILWIADMLDPDVYVLGGSVTDAFDLFAQSMRQVLGDRSLRIVRSTLGPQAAIYGAAALRSSACVRSTTG